MKLACIAAGVFSAVGLTASAQATIVLDFEGFDNGESISNGFIFDTIVGGASITASGDNLGAAIFDSTMGGPNADGPDPDLLVGLGNVLILQNNNTPDMTGDLFDSRTTIRTAARSCSTGVATRSRPASSSRRSISSTSTGTARTRP